MKDNIIKDFDQFKQVNESDMTLLSFISGMAGEQLGKTVKERAVAKLLEYFGVPNIDPNDPQGKKQWITILFEKIIGEVSLKDMDDFLLGKRPLNDIKYWPEKISKALRRQIIAQGPNPGDVVNLLGIEPDKFLGRLISNMYTEYILDEKRLEQSILALWRLVTQEEFIPQKDAGEVYKEAYSGLSDEQKEKVEGSTWQNSMNQLDFFKRKGG